MSERKVLTKYYPPDFDPSAITRSRKPHDVPTKLPTVRLMAPMSMKCEHCGEYIYKGRKFNARKQVTDQTYYNIKIIRFYIKCTRCAAELTFLTDPKNSDYTAERGIKRNFEPWREAKLAEETEEERLDRMEKEEAERDPMKELEQKAMDAKTEMAVADKLDEIRTRNARLERKDREGLEVNAREEKKTAAELAKERQEQEDEDEARRAFLSATGERVKRLAEDEEDEETLVGSASPDRTLAGSMSPTSTTAASTVNHQAREMIPPKPTFAKPKKRKTDHAAGLGIRKKSAMETKTVVQPLVEGDDSFW